MPPAAGCIRYLSGSPQGEDFTPKGRPMQNDNPDTIAIEETQWIHTEVDDVFLPSVRVQLGWNDVEAAVESGAVVPRTTNTTPANCSQNFENCMSGVA